MTEKVRLLIALVLLLPWPAHADAPLIGPNPAMLVIIIDDIGNNLEAGMRTVQLPGEVTLAVLPFTPHGKRLAEAGHEAGKEIMLHAPMSNLSGMDLGPDGLTLDLDQETLTSRLRKAIDDIPHVRGINNHTGSELTAASEPMQWVMSELKLQDLYFVDSMTTSASVAGKTAQENAIPNLRRHVFLDNVREPEAIDQAFQQAVSLAQRQGFAVAIGHPYAETLDYLEQALPGLQESGIRLVSVSRLL
ncbi:divergent polysaccharide deacetylase family protein [Pseudohongiella spirulinae]|uniref:Divergent polysaccharide deacetylase family n=1 Tax=Pseudohongiella spirulinae TaxID=1249552 RepID=A0A0S2K9X1_9GAMM|nr:divergent polysaccharide deacetylase family protein [Pseudohongiella spirulinae]ALO45147.1 Divergent polysaccharide deacetylase family [Pseudohongiella spirulinae]